jgi:hypothetical protein
MCGHLRTRKYRRTLDHRIRSNRRNRRDYLTTTFRSLQAEPLGPEALAVTFLVLTGPGRPGA